jgi:hypothetical protein
MHARFVSQHRALETRPKTASPADALVRAWCGWLGLDLGALGLRPPGYVAGGQQSRSSGECALISEPTMERHAAGGRVIDDKAPLAVSLAFRGYLLPVLVDI